MTVKYRFHPLRGGSYPVIRRHHFRNEVCYVVRRPNGLTVSVPAWMTQPQAAAVEIAPYARVTLAALLELRRLTTIYLSSLASRTHDGGPNVGRRGKATASIRRKAATGAGIKGDGKAGSELSARGLDASDGEAKKHGARQS